MEDNTKFIVSNDDFIKFKQKMDIFADGRSISVNLIKALFEDEKLFHYLLRFVQSDNKEFIINEKDTNNNIRYSKYVLINAIKQANDKGYIGKEFNMRYRIYKYLVSPRNFFNKYENDIYSIVIDGKKYDIPTKNFTRFIQLNDSAFSKIIQGNYETLYGIPKEHFIYAFVCFVKEKDILNSYEVSSRFKSRFSTLSQSKAFDIQAINHFTQPSDKNHEGVNINLLLKEAILKDMPSDLSLLEKTIYIYVKMCNILVYDDEFYVENQKGITRNHPNINYINNITPENNKVVCYEFNAIYGKLLSEMGINFQNRYFNSNNPSYGNGHVFLEYRVGKFLISADSSKTILQNDMTRAKAGLDLKHFESLNNNDKTKDEFKKALNKVYTIASNQKPKTFNELEAEYKKINRNTSIPLEEKLDILLSKINDASLLGVDALSYILILMSVIFNGYELNNNISYVIIKSRLNPVDHQSAMASAIFTVNALGVGQENAVNRYFFYNPGEPLRELSKEELEYYFNEKIFSYMETGSPTILGLNLRS